MSSDNIINFFVMHLQSSNKNCSVQLNKYGEH